MAKKRKASRPSGPSGPREYDPKDSRLRPINTFEDVADSEDEYFINQDKIMLEDEPRSKRLKRQEEEDELLEDSEEEVLDYSEESEDDGDEEEDEETAQLAQLQKAVAKKARRNGVLSDEEGAGDEEEGDQGWWGSSNKEYYNADNIETEADALEEEAEAKKLQKKKLGKMSEADFIFDEDEWLAQEEDKEEGGVVTEVLKEVEVTDDMGPEERYRLLQTQYPELEHLADEFQNLQPQLAVCQQEAEGKGPKSIEVLKHWVLGCYVASLASYFAILTSPSLAGDGTRKTIRSAELRDHDIMETILSCREAWLKVKDLKPAKQANAAVDIELSEVEGDTTPEEMATLPLKKKVHAGKLNGESVSGKKKKSAADKEKRAKAKEIEASLADLSDMLAKPRSTKVKAKVNGSARPQDEGDYSDFGEEDEIDARTANEKASKKKSLKFYTSQIVQKGNRRAEAGRDAGGDMDIPHRERFRDRQLRLNAEAERRGRKDSKHGTALGEGDSGDDGEGAGNVDRDDEYYDMVSSVTRKKKEDKQKKFEAIAAAKGARVVETEEVGEDGKRKISYMIEKNRSLESGKGRKKKNNSRVKKREKYADKQKKLKSMKQVYKGGPGPGGYAGELTGIKTGLIKSIKL
ncbi:Something about silencing protein 10 [Pleurostoma richardsiae]|uniref:Something about silencing protein 10 n=1 Tax=Pleurostoma richardsiae TaxID=41990 RepID=A0AA38RXG4_9PEZI|nr:Something about silencing protein 10 [Pleurostoma richardsiae]